ncbi:MAG: response regulator [Clostridiales bacterium]|nr:response regulator [Clostridiales bacterium]
MNIKQLLKNRKFIYGAIAFLTIAIVVVTAVLYSVFASSLINEESAKHLTEIYSQSSSGFYQKVRSNRNLLKSWQLYIDDIVTEMNADDEEASAAAEQEFREFMLEQLSRFDFTKFYFIGEERENNKYSDYQHVVEVISVERKAAFDHGDTVYRIDISENPIPVRTRRSVKDLLAIDRCGVASFVDEPDKQDITPEFLMLAIPTKVNSLTNARGETFTYNAIGVRFELGTVSNLLSAQTFGTSGICYVILPDGQVLAHSGDDNYVKSDYLAFLKSNQCEVIDTTVAKIANDWKKQRSGTFRLKTRGMEYYVTYMAVDPRVKTDPDNAWDWMLLGIAPSEVVNESMDYFRNITMIVMAAIFVVVGAVIAALIIVNSRRRMAKTVATVKGRDKLLDLLSVNTNDMFIMFSPDTFRADYVSSNVEQVLGIPKDKVMSNALEIIPASAVDQNPLTVDDFKNMPEDDTWGRDVCLQNTETAETRWFRLSLHHSEDQGGKCVLVLSDRTDDKRMREQLEETLEIAKNANAAKSNFLSNMSHDIRTPMNAIIGYATLLAKDAKNPDKVIDYTRKITYSGHHLLGLINDVLDMSKIESGKTSLNMEEFSLPEFIEEIYSIIVSTANAKKQTFDVHTKGNIPEIVTGDKLRLNQIMLNILSNAVKYTPEGGTISVLVEVLKQNIHKHAHIRFIISDNGIGMSPEYVKTIFEPFSREAKEATKNIQGTGLGMAITKNLVDLMGGVISVESEQGKGSTFTVELELAVADALPEDVDFWRHHNVTHVLVIDDEEDVCMEVKELMSDTGVEIEYALNGQEGIKMVEEAVKTKNDFHIILLDWKMAGMDGVETARQIRKKFGRDIPIMVLTSYSFDDIEEEARDAGIDLFLSKPFFVSNFRKAVTQILSDGVEAEVEPKDEDVSIAGLKILAAEDNEINAEILTELMDIEDVKCDIASDGKIALEMFEKSDVDQYDMIFMDVQMPVMNGYEATRAIRACKHERAKTIPIIAMTANAFDDDVKAALDAGMNAHLAKPIDIVKLKQVVADLRANGGKK